MNKYTYTQDPGHGWVRVQRAEIDRLGIANEISSSSYENGKFVYLEEDADAGVFLDAKKERNEKFEIISKHVDNTSIRGFGSYQV